MIMKEKELRKMEKKYLKYFNSSVVSDFILKKTFNIKNSKKFIWD